MTAGHVIWQANAAKIKENSMTITRIDAEKHDQSSNLHLIQ